MTTSTDPLKFYSFSDGDGSGSMNYLLKKAGMKPLMSSLERDLVAADILVFNGGADIGTSIYAEKSIWPNKIPFDPSYRDQFEIDVFNRFSDPRVLKVGICRGAQLLNCLNGGTLWQDVNNHGRDHLMTILKTGMTMPITSTHHQQMRAARGAEIIATASESTYKHAQGIDLDRHQIEERGEADMEVVYYRDTNSLCIQGHPEYVPGSVFAEWCISQMIGYLAEARQNVAA